MKSLEILILLILVVGLVKHFFFTKRKYDKTLVFKRYKVYTTESFFKYYWLIIPVLFFLILMKLNIYYAIVTIIELLIINLKLRRNDSL